MQCCSIKHRYNLLRVNRLQYLGVTFIELCKLMNCYFNFDQIKLLEIVNFKLGVRA